MSPHTWGIKYILIIIKYILINIQKSSSSAYAPCDMQINKLNENITKVSTKNYVRIWDTIPKFWTVIKNKINLELNSIYKNGNQHNPVKNNRLQQYYADILVCKRGSKRQTL